VTGKSRHRAARIIGSPIARQLSSRFAVDSSVRITASSQRLVMHMNFATFNFPGFFGYFRFIGSGPETLGEKRT
jgi:hypothetical protein